MRASMKLLVLVGMLVFVAPAPGAPKKAPVIDSAPSGATYLRDWAERKGFTMAYDAKAMTISLTNRWAEIELANDSRRGSINGVNVWLSFPLRIHDGRLIIQKKDLNTLFEPILFPKRLEKDRTIRVVAIDPGHGGKDPGFQIGNHQEKKYALLLAQEVQKQLEDAGIKTMMTRRSDTYVERGDRAELAAKARADIFVSLHYNCAPDPSAKGVETFAVTPFGAEATNGGEVALRSFPGNKHEGSSALLAYEVQKSVTRSLDLSDRGLRRAGFEVLRLAPMPSILIESGFMSNTADSRKVYNEDHRREMARAIVDGILAYKRIVERTTVSK